MTFQDRKTTGKFWDKTKEKREELHDRNAVKANHPKVIEKEEPISEENTKENQKEKDL